MSEQHLTSVFIDLRRKFLRLAQRFLPSEDDANDALQEAFCRLWPTAERLQNRSEAEAMAVTTIRNLCIDSLRKSQQHEVVELDVGRNAVLEESDQERLEREERHRIIEEIVEQHLSEQQKEVFRLREYEELSFDEIAIRLNMQPASVRVTLSRVRKQIREIYTQINDTKWS